MSAAAPRAAPRFHALDPRRPVDESAYTSRMPPYPARTLLAHCAAKGCEWSVLGLAVFPLLRLTRFRGAPPAAAFRAAFLGAPAAGLAATSLMLAVKARGMDDAGVDDRAFRISKNAGQNEVDREALLGGALGAAAGALARGGALNTLAAASLGVALGVAYHGAELAARWVARLAARA